MKSLITLTLSLFLLVFNTMTSCQTSDDHHHKAPHDGILIEIGNHFGLIEMVHDSKSGELKLWFLNSCADQYVRVKEQKIELVVHGRFLNPSSDQLVTFILKPKTNILTGESKESTSQYHVKNQSLINVTRLKGMILNVNYKQVDFKNLTFDINQKIKN